MSFTFSASEIKSKSIRFSGFTYRVGAYVAVGTLFAMAFIGTAQAQTADTNTRYLAANCANCHGTNGASNVAGAFQLAGLKADYFVEQMKAFKEGKRQASIMHQISKGYSDEQITALAVYFSKQPKAQ